MSATNFRIVLDEEAKVARLFWDEIPFPGFHPVPGGEVILTSPEDCDVCAALKFLSEDQLLDLRWFWIDVGKATPTSDEIVGMEGEATMLATCERCGWSKHEHFTIGDDERGDALWLLQELHNKSGECKSEVAYEETSKQKFLADRTI